MRSKWIIFAGVLIVLALIGALFGGNDNKSNVQQSQQATGKAETNSRGQDQASKINHQEEGKKLSISIEAQNAYKDGKQKVVLWITNNSQYKLKSATIDIRSTDEKDKKLDGDIVWPENIESGKRQYAIMWMKTNTPPVIKYELTKAEFQE